MGTPLRAFRLVTVIALAVALVTPAVAGAPTEQLKQQVDKILALLQDAALAGKPAERQAAIRRIAEEIFDYPDTARRALGPHWNARTPAEREEFVRLFGDLLERAYVARIVQYQGEKVAFLGDRAEGDEATVRTRITTRTGTEVPLDYRMHRKGDRWLVYDVIIEGASLVSNYRSQFNRVIQSESYPALVQKLRTRDAEPAASPARR